MYLLIFTKSSKSAFARSLARSLVVIGWAAGVVAPSLLALLCFPIFLLVPLCMLLTAIPCSHIYGCFYNLGPRPPLIIQLQLINIKCKRASEPETRERAGIFLFSAGGWLERAACCLASVRLPVYRVQIKAYACIILQSGKEEFFRQLCLVWRMTSDLKRPS